jgi:hypothetical protein
MLDDHAVTLFLICAFLLVLAAFQLLVSPIDQRHHD